LLRNGIRQPAPLAAGAAAKGWRRDVDFHESKFIVPTDVTGTTLCAATAGRSPQRQMLASESPSPARLRTQLRVPARHKGKNYAARA
jgi:hypothetical protein